MANRVFDQVLAEQIDIFKNAFSSVSRAVFYDETTGEAVHSGEFGMYRESVCREFLRFFVPDRLDITHGFLINAQDEISSQCDIVLYDSNSTPLILSESRQRFFPVETVCAVGEVKSKVSQSDLREALDKLAKTKQMRDYITEPTVVWQRESLPYSPDWNVNDQIFTFLVCEKLDFKFENLALDELYEGSLLHKHRHNIILSLQDGLLGYWVDIVGMQEQIAPYPVLFPEKGIRKELKDGVVESNSENVHLRYFAHFLFLAMSRATVLFPDLANYMVPPSSLTTGRFT